MIAPTPLKYFHKTAIIFPQIKINYKNRELLKVTAFSFQGLKLKTQVYTPREGYLLSEENSWRANKKKENRKLYSQKKNYAPVGVKTLIQLFLLCLLKIHYWLLSLNTLIIRANWIIKDNYFCTSDKLTILAKSKG